MHLCEIIYLFWKETDDIFNEFKDKEIIFWED